MAFSILMTYDCVAMARRGEMDDYFGDPTRMHARFGWPLPRAQPLDAAIMHWLPHLLGACAACFGFGPPLVRAISLLAWSVGWGYLFLCDAARYVNHHYLFLLVGLLLFLVACTARRPERRRLSILR